MWKLDDGWVTPWWKEPWSYDWHLKWCFERRQSTELILVSQHLWRVLFSHPLTTLLLNILYGLSVLLHKMVDDCKDWWGVPIMCRCDVACVHAQRMEGIPSFAYWATLLDPQTKIKTVKESRPRERIVIWKVCMMTLRKWMTQLLLMMQVQLVERKEKQQGLHHSSWKQQPMKFLMMMLSFCHQYTPLLTLEDGCRR